MSIARDICEIHEMVKTICLTIAQEDPEAARSISEKMTRLLDELEEAKSPKRIKWLTLEIERFFVLVMENGAKLNE